MAGRSPELVETEDISNFHVEYQAIWDDLSQSWISYRKQEKS
jgi:hypothetical protein